MSRIRSWFIVVLSAPLLLGQDCSAPAIVQPGVPSSIPAGEYSGQVRTTARLLVGGAPQNEQNATADQSQSFGNVGELLAKGNLPLYVGYEETRTIAGMNITLTVVSIQPSAAAVAINYTAMLTLTVGASTYKMSGTGQATFTLVSAGSIGYQMSLDLSHTGTGGSVVGLELDSAGTLYR